MIRSGTAADLPAVARIQADAKSAAQWPVEDYLAHQFWVATELEQVVGYLVLRPLGAGEFELLNIAVSESKRGQGWGRKLLGALPAGTIFLEVRESNWPAIALYTSTGFQPVGRRREYYQNPPEDGIVMVLKK